MSESFSVRILGELVPSGLTYGHNYLVEFEPQSLWYEASLTIAAHALKRGVKTEYHTFLHLPSEVRASIAKNGVDVGKLELEGVFRIIDTYTLTTGLAAPEKPVKGPEPYESQSFDVEHWSRSVERRIKEGFSEEEKRWIHLDDTTSVLNSYAPEKSILEVWRTRFVPYTRAREVAMVHSLVTGVASEPFYKEFEAFADGIFDFRALEENRRLEHYVRARSLRGRACDTSWHRLQLLDNGEVQLSPLGRDSEIGIRRWLRGPKK